MSLSGCSCSKEFYHNDSIRAINQSQPFSDGFLQQCSFIYSECPQEIASYKPFFWQDFFFVVRLMWWNNIDVKNICKYLTVLLLFHRQIRNLLQGMKIYIQTYQLRITIMKISLRSETSASLPWKIFISSDRSSCTDDGLLYIYPATFSDFEHLCLSILLQVSL